MNPPTKPGQQCRAIGGRMAVIGGRMAFNGEGASPNLGKTATTMFLHAEQAGMEQENVWHCQGEGPQTYYGVGTEADFLECRLEVAEPRRSKPRPSKWRKWNDSRQVHGGCTI